MNRHLLPNEVDLLVDGEVGFGMAPLKGHVIDCADCRARVEEGRAVVEALERAPHFAPSPLFAERVMARVEVFTPWHVAALETARRLIPRSPPVRIAAGALAASIALVLTLGTVWMLANADLLLAGGQLVADRARGAVITSIGSVVGSVFGPTALDALRQGGPVLLVGSAAAIIALAAATAFGMRRLVNAASRRRS